MDGFERIGSPGMPDAATPRARPNVLAFATALYGASVVLHRVGNEQADRLRRALGDPAWDGVCAGTGLGLLVLVLAVAWRAARQTRAPRIWASRLTTLVVGSGLSLAPLMTLAVEWVHLVQYALVIGLFAHGLPSTPAAPAADSPMLGTPAGSRVGPFWSAPRTLSLVGVGLALGLLDEAVQWAVLYRERSDLRLDLPDVGLDTIGAVWGVTLARLCAEARADLPAAGPPQV